MSNPHHQDDLCRTLAAYLAAKGIDQSTTRMLIYAWSQQECDPPMPNGSTHFIVDQVYRPLQPLTAVDLAARLSDGLSSTLMEAIRRQKEQVQG